MDGDGPMRGMNGAKIAHVEKKNPRIASRSLEPSRVPERMRGVVGATLRGSENRQEAAMVSLSESGKCVFKMYMPHAGSVELLGTFCGWKAERGEGAIELERDDEGWWTAKVNLPEGDHEFCYLVDGRTWMPDYAAGGVKRSSTGRWVSLLSVAADAPTVQRPIGALAEPRIGRAPERQPARALAHT
jgi:hypothetical protein